MPVYYRDQITLDDGVTQQKLDSLSAGETLFVMAASVGMSGGTLRVSQGSLVVVCDMLTGTGVVDARGNAGAQGPTGEKGRIGGTRMNGRPGGGGGVGSPGSNGGAISIFSLASDATIKFTVAGGQGGRGGTGGQGGPGQNYRETEVEFTARVSSELRRPPPMGGTQGGPGGSGGTGGTGGSGGTLTVVSTTFPPWDLDCSGGLGGAGGWGGAPGENANYYDGNDRAPRGQSGADGAQGPGGTLAQHLGVSLDTYWDHVRGAAASFIGQWAEHRLEVASYYARCYVPNHRDHYATLARKELDAIDRLQPDPRSSLLRERLTRNVNVLGLSRDLDVYPDFDAYISSFARFADLALGIFSLAHEQVMTASTLSHLKAILHAQAADVQRTANDLTDEQAIRKIEVQHASDELASITAQVEEALRKVEALRESSETWTVGEIFTTIGAVAGIIGGLIAAIPTAGASVCGVVGGVFAISSIVLENHSTIGHWLLDKNSDLRKQVLEKADAVGADVKNIKAGVEVVVSLVNLVKKLAEGKSADNEEMVELLQHSVELAYERLQAEHRHKVAVMRSASIAIAIERARTLTALIEQAGTLARMDEAYLRASSIAIVKGIQAQLDRVLVSLFYAQRSIEIYTLDAAPIFLDIGHVHPDIEIDYIEGTRGVSAAVIMAAHANSWSGLLQPAQLQARFDAYFSQNQIHTDIRRLSFADTADLERLRTERRLDFSIDPLVDLNPEHFNTKIQQVFVSFVGATSLSGVVSTEIAHGPRYTQVALVGEPLNTAYLEPRRTTPLARQTRLELAGVTLNGTQAPDSPQELPLWGRGVGGRWQLRIPDYELTHNALDLSGVQEIQVWIGYQFLRG